MHLKCYKNKNKPNPKLEDENNNKKLREKLMN
jgi:hypothetical protein